MSTDRFAIEQLFQVSKPGALHGVRHYLYFPAKDAAAQAATELRRVGYTTEVGLGADGRDWLVLARHEIVPTEATIGAARRLMERLTLAGAGEYDGWEAEVQA